MTDAPIRTRVKRDDTVRVRVQQPDKIRVRVLPSLLPKEATIEVGTVTTLAPGEDATVVNVGTPQDVVFNFGIPQGEAGDAGGRPVLSADLDLYVATTGNDSSDGSETSPFLTVQHMVDVAATYDANQHNVALHVADGDFPETVTISAGPLQAASFKIVGSLDPDAITGLRFKLAGFVEVAFEGGFQTDNFEASGKAILDLNAANISWITSGPATQHVSYRDHAKVKMAGITEKITGDFGFHTAGSGPASLEYKSAALEFVGAPTFVAFVAVSDDGEASSTAGWDSSVVTGACHGKPHLATYGGSIYNLFGDPYPGDDTGSAILGGIYNGVSDDAGGGTVGNTVIETGNGPYTVADDTSVLILNRGTPGASAVTLGSVAARAALPLDVFDWAGNAGDITVTPDGSETIMGLSTWTLGSSADSKAGKRFIPNTDLSGWLTGP